MKTILVVTIFALSYFYSSVAQENPEQRINISRTWISLNNAPFKIEGVLYEIKDSSIVVSNSKVKGDYNTGNFKISEFNYNDIDFVKARRKNSIITGALIGAAPFIVFGFYSATINEEGGYKGYIPPESIALMYGLIFGPPVVIMGAVVGSIKIRIPINASIEMFNRNKNKLKKYSIRE